MIARKSFKNRCKQAFLRCLFVIIMIFAGFGALAGGVIGDNPAYAEPADVTTPTVINPSDGTNDGGLTDDPGDTTTPTTPAAPTTPTDPDNPGSGSDDCQDSLGAVSWLVCPTTGKIAEAVDWLYDKIENILVINPIEAKDGMPIYEIWKYCRGLTNIVFIIFLLVVIYSQLTGVGISNYGLKKALPKLIVAAVMVNLSFLVCQLGVDVSNIVGNSLRGVFTAVQDSAIASMEITPEAAESMNLAYSQLYGVLAGGSVLTIGAAFISFETGAIWMLIPIVLGAIVAVASGLITIALRQAVVALLVMVAPLAIVANILPNTEKWFKKWKDLLIQMLIFYPMFSLLFGASSLAGFAIIASAKDAFWLILGLAVQVFPLFFSWSLMKMSGTVLGTINTKMRGLASRPLAGTRSWADSRRQATRAKHLASERTRPSLALMQYMSNRRIAREEETNENLTTAKNRGLAYRASRNYHKDGSATREGAKAYKQQAENMRYAEIIERDKNNMNKGLGSLEAQPKSAALRARLKQLDVENVTASDNLKIERARGAMIEYRNAEGFQKRISDAMDAHMDVKALEAGDKTNRLHGVANDANVARYETMKKIMEGNETDVHFAGADAAHAFNAQAQIVKGKFQNYFDLTAPTQDVVHRLEELTTNRSSSEYVDPIIAGLRTLNLRGDTDLIRGEVVNMLRDKKVELGTYASQSLASFLMFDVKGNDPFLRRLGKYINLETAAMYNDRPVEELSKRRTKKSISLYEYVNGEYVDEDENGNVIYDVNGNPSIRKPKRGAAVLLKGTSFKDMERTAIANMIESIREFSIDPETGEFDYEKFKKNEGDIWNAIMPNIISDQYSFLSGSEQIIALGKGVTGVDSQKHGFDWEGIFGEKIASQLTPEQKKDYIEFLNKRTKTFLGGQVPSQIAKTKTDMLESIKNQYVLKDMLDKDPELLEQSLGKVGNKMTDDEYKKQEKEHLSNVKREFVGSFKEDALKGFVKMHHKGYQGEAKDGLIQLLEPDELYKQFFANSEENAKNKKRDVQEDDDEDGMPVNNEDEAGNVSYTIHNETSEDIEDVFERYRGANGGDVEGFWGEVKDILKSSTETHVGEEVFEEIEKIIPQCTNVAALYSYIMNKIFGGLD